MKIIYLLLIVTLSATSWAANSSPVDKLLHQYGQTASKPFSASDGKILWTKSYPSARTPLSRACTSCHNTDPSRSGRHVRTKKEIKPLARSINSDSLSDMKKIKKGLKRNCKWTIGRECSAQEKGNILTYLKEL